MLNVLAGDWLIEWGIRLTCNIPNEQQNKMREIDELTFDITSNARENIYY